MMNDIRKLPTHLYSLDLARGVAALCVVISHYSHFFFIGGRFFVSDRTEYPMYELLTPFYLLASEAVGFFFILSGFIFFWLYRDPVSKQECGLEEFSIARFSRLYPLHLISLLIMAILQMYYTDIVGVGWVFTENSLWAFTKHLFMLSMWGEPTRAFNAPSGTVSIELGLYYIFFALAFIKAARWQYVLLIAAACFMPIAGAHRTTWLFAISAFFVGGLTFMVTKAYITGPLRNRAIDIILVGIAAACWIQVYDVDYINNVLKNRLVYVPFVLPITILALVILDTRFNAAFKRVRLLGDISYSIYMLHLPIQLTLVLLFIKADINPEIFFLNNTLLIYVLLVLSIGTLSYRYIERPAQSRLRFLHRKMRPKATSKTAPRAE